MNRLKLHLDDWSETDERAFRQYKRKLAKQRKRNEREEKKAVEAILSFVNSTWKGSNGWN